MKFLRISIIGLDQCLCLLSGPSEIKGSAPSSLCTPFSGTQHSHICNIQRQSRHILSEFGCIQLFTCLDSPFAGPFALPVCENEPPNRWRSHHVQQPKAYSRSRAGGIHRKISRKKFRLLPCSTRKPDPLADRTVLPICVRFGGAPLYR